jgi:agmatine/peptidylarginine deiminase
MTRRLGRTAALAVLLAVAVVWGYFLGMDAGRFRLAEPARGSRRPHRPATGPEQESTRAIGLAAHAAEFEDPGAVLIGAGELVDFHPQVLSDLIEAADEAAALHFVFSRDDQLRKALRIASRLDPGRRNVRFAVLATETMWMRDYGPLFVELAGPEPLIVDADCSLAFEGSDPPDMDNDFPRVLARATAGTVVSLPLRIQGGNFLTNGDGLVVTTSLMLDENVEAGLDTEKIRSRLARWFGCRQWVTVEPLMGESTGHVDMFMAFVDTDQVVVGRYDPEDDPVNAAILDRAAAALEGLETCAGPMRVHRIWMPPRGPSDLWRTYTNVIFAGPTVFVPVYDGVDPDKQREAVGRLCTLLPGRRVVEIPCQSLIPLGGALRCISMQVPAGMDLGGFWVVPDSEAQTPVLSGFPDPDVQILNEED